MSKSADKTSNFNDLTLKEMMELHDACKMIVNLYTERMQITPDTDMNKNIFNLKRKNAFILMSQLEEKIEDEISKYYEKN